MPDHIWSDVRHQAIAAFHGETPGAQVEQRVIDVFRRRPQLVIDSIAYVAEQRKLGRVKQSCWGVLAHHVEQADHMPADVVASDETERAKAISRAEHWIDRAGLHLPSEHEILDELFGDRPGHTPPVEYLEQLDRDSHGPGRALYGALLAAAIRRTTEHGTEPIPGPGDGPLREYDTPELRQRMLDRWHARRPDGVQTDLDADARGRQWRDQRAAAKARPAAAVEPKPAPEPQPEPQPAVAVADLDF